MVNADEIRAELVADLRRRLASEPDSVAAASLVRALSQLLDKVESPAVGSDAVSELAVARRARRGRAAG